MVTKTPTPVLIDTAILSQIVSDVLDLVGAPSTKKSACLNKAAARIVGAKFNWGFMTGREMPIIALGVKGFDVAALSTAEPEQAPSPQVDVEGILRDAFSAQMPVTLLMGAPGDGKHHDAVKASMESGFEVMDLRLGFLSDAEIAIAATPGSRLPVELRPATGKTVTIYSDLDELSDTALIALVAELTAFRQSRQEGHVILICCDPESLLPRLRSLAPAVLNHSLSVTVSQPIVRDRLGAFKTHLET